MASDLINFYRSMFLIRTFEETLLELFETGILFGTTHTCIGQKHIPVALFEAINREKDVVFASHRCHGHFLAYCGEFFRLACEIMGREDGVVRGIGGSQHIHYRNFYSNGVQGGIVANATGAALAEKTRASGAVTVALLGDGTFGQGIIYESFNIASLWGLPVLYIVENNHYAQSTPLKLNFAGSFAARFSAFGISCCETESDDPVVLRQLFADQTAQVREKCQPGAVIVHTYRLASHSKSDDCRDENEVAYYAAHDPLGRLRSRIDEAVCGAIETESRRFLCDVFDRAKMAPLTSAL